MPLLKFQLGILEQLDTPVAVIQLQTAAPTQQYQPHPHDDTLVSRHDGTPSGSHPDSPQYYKGNEQAIDSSKSSQSLAHTKSLSSFTTRPQAMPMTPQSSRNSPQPSRTPSPRAQPRRYRPATGYEVSTSQVL